MSHGARGALGRVKLLEGRRRSLPVACSPGPLCGEVVPSGDRRTLRASVSKIDLAFWLGLYASVIASATGLWSLFRELWLERARLDVVPDEAWLVKTTGSGKMIVKGDDTLQTMEVPVGARSPILEVVIRNRGRRDAEIRSISQRRPGGVFVFGDLLPQIPLEIPGERTKVLVMGDRGGYAHGSIALARFFVVDGANRIHPLSERYRQRLDRLLRRRS